VVEKMIIFIVEYMLKIFLISFGVYFLLNILQILRQRNFIKQKGNDELVKVLKELSNALEKKNSPLE